MLARFTIMFIGLVLGTSAIKAADQWRYEFTTLDYVDSFASGGIIAKGNVLIKHIVNGQVTQFPGENLTLTLWGGNGSLGCLNLLTAAYINGKKFMLLTKDGVPFQATPTALNLNASTDLDSCGLRNQ